MRIVLFAIGTRGDVQPAIALGKGLQAAGHAVMLVAGENFEAWVRGHGLGYASTLDMEALMKSPEGIAWVEEPNPMRQLRHMKRLLDMNAGKMNESVAVPARGADLLISSFISLPFAQAAAEKFGIPHVSGMLQPYRATSSSAASLTPVVRGNNVVNRWMGVVAERMIWGTCGDTTNAFRAELGLAPHTNATYRRALYATPTFYGFSPNVVPPPPEWGDSSSVVGYWFLDEAYTPPAALTRFLDAGAPPVYVGFGSMSTATPEGTVGMIAEALRQNGQRGIVASGWSGAAIRNPPEHVYLLDSAPHGWLFDHVAAVVHHGGAGTTGAGLRAGKPTLIVPHFSDQPYWGKRVYDLGVGAKPVTRHTLTAEKLAAGIHTLVSDRSMAQKAAALGTQIRAERGVENAVRWIEQHAER